VDNTHRQFVEVGFERIVEGNKCHVPKKKVVDGKVESYIIATRLGESPSGYAHFSLRLLAN
jgi:hypothetical protein